MDEIQKIIKVDVSNAEKSIEGLTSKVKDLKGELNSIPTGQTFSEKSVKTVKDLRDEIKTLRDELVSLEKGSDEYNNVVRQLIEDETKLTDVMRAGKNEVSAATGSYNALQNEMTALRKVWKETTDEAQRAEIGARINEINTTLKDMDATIGNHQRKVGSYEEAIRAVTAEYTSQKAELKALRVALENLEPGTEEYNKAFMRAAEITHNLTDQQERLKYASTDLGDQISNLRSIAANVAAGFSAAQAAIGLFGGENEEVAQAMLKVQQAMALVQGLQGLDGFIKRTEGMSSALKKWIADSKAVTTTIVAQTTAEKANATATNVQTVATEGATVAQKGLNAAMKANPIGFIIGIIATLIVSWKSLTSWVGKLVGGFDNLNKIVNKFKVIVSGLANVIVKGLLVPVKEAINYVATLGKVLKDVFTLNWSEIGKDIKEGVKNSVDIMKDGYDVAANYASAKEKEITRQQEEEARERATKRKEELNDIIADNEAKIGSDWKYTEEGKKYYQEYFDSLLTMYKKDSQEFKEAQRDKWEYDRELAEKQKKDEEDANKKSEEERKKRLAAAKSYTDKMKKIEQDYQSKIAAQVGSDLGSIYADYDEKYNAFIEYYDKLGKMLDKSASATDKKLAAWLNKYTKTVSSYNDLVKRDGARIINETKAFLKGLSIEEFGDFFKQSAGEDYWEKQFGGLTDEKKLEKWNKWVENMGEKTGISFSLGLKMRFINERNRIEKLFESLVNDSVENSSREANKKINDEIIQLFQKTIRPQVDDELTRLQLEIDKKTIKLDFEIETGLDGDAFINNEDFIPIKNFDRKAAELEKATEVYHNALQQLLTQRNFYQQTVDYVNENSLIPSEEYEAAIAKIEEIDNKLNQVHVDYYKTNAEIRDRYFAEGIQKIQDNAANEERLVQKHYNEIYTANSNYLNGRRELSGAIMEHDIKAAEETYQIQKKSLEEQLNMYHSYLSDITVSGEQRVEAEKMVAELIAQIEEGEVAHTREMNELRIQSFQMWYSMAQDAVGGISDLIGSLSDVYEANIKAQVEAGEIQEDEANRQFENVKGMRIAEAVINTIAGAIGTYMNAVTTYAPPYGEIIGGISAAAVTAAGVAQIANIRAQKLGGSSSISNSPVATPQVQSYQPTYVENPTGNSEQENLRNTLMEQPIYVKVTDIDAAQEGRKVRVDESSF